MLLVVTHRPEFAQPWIGRPQVTALTVNRLGRREIDVMIDRIAGNKALPEAIRADIAERADGVPLFAEEIAKAAVEAADEAEVTVAILTPLMQIKGYAAPETMAATERARLAIKQAEELGESLEDPLLFFSVLYGLIAANWGAFNGAVIRELATQFLTLAEKKGATGLSSDIAIWVLHCTSQETSQKPKRITIRRFRCITPPSIVPYFTIWSGQPRGRVGLSDQCAVAPWVSGSGRCRCEMRDR